MCALVLLSSLCDVSCGHAVQISHAVVGATLCLDCDGKNRLLESKFYEGMCD